MADYLSKMDARKFEEIVLATDHHTGLKAIIAIHSTARGPALGGTRMWTYKSEDDAVEDAMRLARGMSYKSAAAELPLGGGKAVIMGDSNRDKTEALLRSYGRVVERLNGRYITAEDMGIKDADLDIVRQETKYVMGGSAVGSPSPFTAFGVYSGIKAAVAEVTGSKDLKDLVFAVQGIGGVGSSLCQYLHDDGAKLIVADLDDKRTEQAKTKWGAKVVAPDNIHSQDCDVFAPCGIGAIINKNSIPELNCRIVAGAANNVLEVPSDGEKLKAKGILYAPDYIINAGGIIFVELRRQGIKDDQKIFEKAGKIEDRLAEIFRRARESNKLPEEIADIFAEEKLSEAKK